MKSKLHNFEVGKHLPPEQWEREGKADWQDYVVVTLSRGKAFELVHDILRQLYRPDADVESVTLPLFGELSERRPDLEDVFQE